MKTRVYDFKYIYKGLAYYMGQEYYAEGRINGCKYIINYIYNGYTRTEIVNDLKDKIREKAAQNA